VNTIAIINGLDGTVYINYNWRRYIKLLNRYQTVKKVPTQKVIATMINNNNSSHSKKMRRRGNSTANATSPLAMGKALVLTITVGSAAAFSGGSSNSAIQTQRISTSRRIHHNSPNYNRHFLHNPNHSNNEFHSIGALHYRDGDEDQSSSMRVANRSAVDEATGSNTATTISTETPNHSSSSRGVSKVNLFMPIVGLMPSMPHAPSHSVEEDKEQLAMDQYLEYLDRRYSRLKPTSSHTKRPKGGVIMDIPPIRKIFFSTLSLHKLPVLTAAAFGSPHASTSEEEEKKKAKESREVRREALRRNGHESEDALKSLGLSSLASARLQQRLHVPRDLRDEYMSLTSGTTNAVNFINHIVHLNDVPVILSPKKTAADKAVTADMEGGRTSSYTSLSFTAQFKLLFSTLRNVTLAFVNTMQILTAFASRMVSEVLDKGGFRRSVRLMSIVPIMLVFMFKPLFRGAMKQGTKV